MPHLSDSHVDLYHYSNRYAHHKNLLGSQPDANGKILKQYLVDLYLQAKIASVRNIVDAAGLIWFVIGNMWLFTEDFNCSNPWGSPVYVYCVIMIIINYIQICLPCIIAILLIPVFCFCMPCLIRLLARMQDAAAPKVKHTETMSLLTVLGCYRGCDRGTGASHNPSI